MSPPTPVSIVMGGTSGVGLATARLLASVGHRVIATGRTLTRVADLSIAGLTFSAVDARNAEAVRAFYRATGPFQHLVVALSGAKGAGPFAALPLADLREGFDTKFFPQVQVAQLALGTLRAGGSITFVSAISARRPRPGLAGLAAINGAIEAMVPALAQELRPTRVNAVSPGVIDTPWWDWMAAADKAAAFQQYGAAAPVGRVGRPEEVADAIRFLITNEFVTGSVIECDGGLRLS